MDFRISWRELLAKSVFSKRVLGCLKKHMACCEKYKPYILKYVPYILK